MATSVDRVQATLPGWAIFQLRAMSEALGVGFGADGLSARKVRIAQAKNSGGGWYVDEAKARWTRRIVA